MFQAGIHMLLDANKQALGAIFYPVLLPEGCVKPAGTFQIVGGSSMPTLDTSGLQKWRMQFDCFDDTSYLKAASARKALVALLNGYQGLLSDGTYLQNVDLIQVVDYFDQDPRQYRCMAEFYLYFCF